MASIGTTYDPDREKEPREVSLGRLRAEVHEHGWMYFEAEPQVDDSVTSEENEAWLLDRWAGVIQENSQGTFRLGPGGWERLS